MNTVRNDFPLVAMVRHRPGNIETKPFYSEADYQKYVDWARPTWAILMTDPGGQVVVQNSYPDTE